MLDEEEDWSLCIERLVDEHTRGGDAVLVFFKNEEQLRKFRGEVVVRQWLVDGFISKGGLSRSCYL